MLFSLNLGTLILITVPAVTILKRGRFSASIFVLICVSFCFCFRGNCSAKCVLVLISLRVFKHLHHTGNVILGACTHILLVTKLLMLPLAFYVYCLCSMLWLLTRCLLLFTVICCCYLFLPIYWFYYF